MASPDHAALLIRTLEVTADLVEAADDDLDLVTHMTERNHAFAGTRPAASGAQLDRWTTSAHAVWSAVPTASAGALGAHLVDVVVDAWTLGQATGRPWHPSPVVVAAVCSLTGAPVSTAGDPWVGVLTHLGRGARPLRPTGSPRARSARPES